MEELKIPISQCFTKFIALMYYWRLRDALKEYEDEEITEAS